MKKWTDEEIDYAFSLLEEFNQYSFVTRGLQDAGFDRTYDSVQKMFKRYEEESYPSGPKVLLLDIETLPIITYSWGIWKQNLSDFQIIEDWCLLSWSAKWLGDSYIYSDILTPNEAVNRKDKRICKTMWNLLDECDLVIAHNGDRFDLRKLNARFMNHRMDPPSPYLSIDTLKQSRRNFAFTTHKLDFLSQIISNKEKIKTDFALWRGCDNGDVSSLNKMLSYNKHDVLLLEEVYLSMLPWMKGIPNFALYTSSNKTICGHCGSSDLKKNGFYVTPANKYQSYKCMECGCFVRDRISSLSKEQKQNLKINLAK